MAVQRSFLWLRLLLTTAVIVPAVAAVALLVYSVHATGDWDRPIDAPAFALCGMFGMVPIAVGVVWLAVRAFVRQDAELHAGIACGCVLGVVMTTISLGDAAFVGLGIRDGRVPADMLAAVAVAWLYFLAVGLGHWHLSRALSADNPSPE